MLPAFPTLALAEEEATHARLLCTEHAAIIQFSDNVNGAPPVFFDLPEIFATKFEDATEFPELECGLGSSRNQRMLRLKIGDVQPLPWGICGAGAQPFFSLWIGGHKIFSKKTFHTLCHWGQFLDVNVIVSEGGWLLLCAYPNTTENWPNTTPPIPDQLACTAVNEIYSTALNGPIDEIEYPADGTERREGHVELRSSTEDELCNRLLVGLDEHKYAHMVFRYFPDEFHHIGKLRSDEIPRDRYGSYVPHIVDINNDGFADMIAVRSRGRHGEDYYISMLIDGGLTPVTDGINIPPPASAIPLFGGEWADHLDNSYELIIFEWHGKAYILMSGLYPSSTRDWIVMQMQPDGTADTICELDRIEINF